MSTQSSGREPGIPRAAPATERRATQEPLGTEPVLHHRAAQRYAGIHMRVTPDTIASSVDDAFPELFGWLAAREISAAGPPLIRYHAMEPTPDGACLFDLDIGVPIDVPATGEGWVHLGELPAGRWVTAIHLGPYDRLRDSTAALGTWARAHGLTQSTDAGGRFPGWAEHYLAGAHDEPDVARWRTEIAVLVDG